ncbi:MAG TPA: M3 family metallopeptidase, partial [Bacteroidales bacterium]|nr:M3 family metallopeptidase [Bacteroidales bacterium]
MKLPMIVLFSAALLAGCTGGKKENPFFSRFDTPFGVPPFDKIKNEHFLPAIQEGIKQHAKEIDKIASLPEAPTFENTILALDRSGEMLERVTPVFFNLYSANTNEELQKINQEVTPVLTKHMDDIFLNAKLFNRVKAVYDARQSLNLKPEQMKLLDNTYKNFVRAGADLPEAEKEKLRNINQELSMLTVKFGDNLLAENKSYQLVIDNPADLEGMPQSVIDMAAQTAKERNLEGKWVFTLDVPSIVPFLQYNKNRALREQIKTAYANRANHDNEYDNKNIISQIVKLRLEKARMLGFNTYADYVLDRNMAKIPANVYDLLMRLWNAALPVAQKEAADMQKLIDQEKGGFKLAKWDWWYYAEKVRKQKYDLDENMLRPYFELNNVREGVFYTANRLYGITFKPLPDLPKYHPDVQSFEVLDKDSSHLGILYLDFFPRAGKRGGAWCTEFREQVKDEKGNRIPPVVSIVTNFTVPSGNTPSLLSPDEVETFFHEFGHALHSLFADYTYRGTAEVPRDFVELPSQIMEHWAFEPEVLQVYAKHYQTGEVIPTKLIDKIVQSGKFNQGFATVEYLAASILDMDYHTVKDTVPVNVPSFEKQSMD